MRVLVTGAKGLLGTDIGEVFSKAHEVIPLGHEELEVTDAAKTISIIQEIQPGLVLHIAGFHRVDGCELDPDKAYLINTIGTRNVALGCLKTDSIMVYTSSGAVFDGEKEEPYIEFDKTNPITVYGRSKLLAERIVCSLLNKYFIVRLSILFGKHGKPGLNPIVDVLRAAQEKGEVIAEEDRIVSHTYTTHAARAIARLVETEFYGLYHIANKGSISRYGFAKEVVKQAGIKGVNVKAIKSAQLKRPARRMRYSMLRNFCLESTIGYAMPFWKEAVHECLESILPFEEQL